MSLGSNRALEYLSSGAIDIGSTTGLAAVLGKANGNPIRAVYIFSRPERTALVVRKDSPIKTLADLKGKKIAATNACAGEIVSLVGPMASRRPDASVDYV